MPPPAYLGAEGATHTATVLAAPARDHVVISVICGLTSNPLRPALTRSAAMSAAVALNAQRGELVMAVPLAALLQARRVDLARALFHEHDAGEPIPDDAEPVRIGDLAAYIVDPPPEPIDAIRTVRFLWRGRQVSLLVDLDDPSSYPDDAWLSSRLD